MTYRWIDDSPMNGVNYYRLSQTDFDGTSETFAPIAITCETDPLDGYSIYPNPANSVLNIDLELENYQGDDVIIEVLDINGKIIQSKSIELNRGFNHLELNFNDIPSGVYMINFVGTKDYIKEGSEANKANPLIIIIGLKKFQVEKFNFLLHRLFNFIVFYI